CEVLAESAVPKDHPLASRISSRGNAVQDSCDQACAKTQVRRLQWVFPSIVFTRCFIFSRTVLNLFLAGSVSNAVCATASLIGLYSFASLPSPASLKASFGLSTKLAR